MQVRQALILPVRSRLGTTNNGLFEALLLLQRSMIPLSSHDRIWSVTVERCI